ncbi:DUF2493 domain-containing protein [Chryseobacterium turcicum]|uniref:DUF2493 domain-containing protein n=1 Tax=Chryseobacterium turcicum TaxID=2898076 RepID=A0A9Q3YXF0_9FLAO|nr:DUF2493 domain-containing protein [Chryseobacterium turcicum]MCD1119113.1 DUF2493 domain-containing protein [Chryseobacterium turcicum]
MNIAIVGGRDFSDYNLLKNTLNNYIENKSFLNAIVSGGAKGADSLAEKYAQELDVEIIIYRPDYKKNGRLAALHRNTEIIENSDIVFAFWNGKSRGTLDSITKAKKLEKTLFIINY